MIGYNGLDNLVWFVGFVARGTDPTKLGRIKVRAIGFHPTVGEGAVHDTELPWAFVIKPNSVMTGQFKTGEFVFGCFLDGRDAQQPLVLGVIGVNQYMIPTNVNQVPAQPQNKYNTNPHVRSNSQNTPAPTGGGRVTQEEAYQLALDAGFTPDEARTMAAISVAESSLNPNSLNDNPDTGDLSYGLWQINMIGAMGPERRNLLGISSNDALYDPVTNARAARAIYNTQGFNAWSVYRDGSYSQYLNNIPQS